MLSLFKKIFTKGAPGQPAAPQPAPKAAGPREVKPSSSPAPAPAAQPAAPNATAAQPPPGGGDSLKLSLSAIVGLFPKDLPGPANPAMIDGVKVNIPVSRVLQQLPHGSAKISFGELRRVSPPGAFRSNGAADEKMVDLPLSEILPQLAPTQFARRPGQKRVEVPDDVAGIFTSEGGRLSTAGVTTTSTSPTKGPRAVSAAPAPAPVAAPTPAIPVPAPVARASAAPVARPTAPAPVSAPTPSAATVKAHTIIQFPNAPSTPAAAPAPSRPAPVQPVVKPPQSPAQRGPAPLPQALPKPAPAKPSAPAPSTTPAAEGTLAVSLAEVSQAWSEPVQEEINALGLSDSTVELPAGEVGESLKGGKVLFHWRRLRYWIKPTPPSDTSPHAETLLELPLNIIAPLFLSKCRTGSHQKKHAVDESIPDLFSGGDKPEQPAKAHSETTVLKRVASGDESLFSVPLADAAANWPEAVREEIARYSLGESFLSLPLEQIGVGLKQGRIVYHWRQLRYWIKPLPPTGSSPHGETLLELPLNVIAPLYLEQRGRVSDNTAQLIRSHVPDMSDTQMHRFMEPVALPPSRTSARETVPAKQAKDLAELFNKPGKTRWTPHEIVECVSRVPGVIGSLITLQDGLLVAGQVPAPWKSETVSAFLPQIHGRMRTYTSELRLGDLSSFSVAVDSGTLQVFNAGVIYFAVLCRAGETVPQHPLHLIVTELGRHSK